MVIWLDGSDLLKDHYLSCECNMGEVLVCIMSFSLTLKVSKEHLNFVFFSDV